MQQTLNATATEWVKIGNKIRRTVDYNNLSSKGLSVRNDCTKFLVCAFPWQLYVQQGFALRVGTIPFVSRYFSYRKHVKLKRVELGSQVDFSQVVLGNFICIPVRLISENPAIYFKRLSMAGQIMFSYHPFVSQMFTVCFLEFSLYVFDIKHSLWQVGHRSDWVISGLPQQELSSVWQLCSFCCSFLARIALHTMKVGQKLPKLSYYFYKLEN